MRRFGRDGEAGKLVARGRECEVVADESESAAASLSGRWAVEAVRDLDAWVDGLARWEVLPDLKGPDLDGPGLDEPCFEVEPRCEVDVREADLPEGTVRSRSERASTSDQYQYGYPAQNDRALLTVRV